MIVLLLIFIAVCLWQVKLKSADNAPYMTDYMSINKTMAVKGIFIILVFFSHFNSYVDFTNVFDQSYYTAYQQISQRMVTLFLLYSGYGVMEAIKRKKMTYVHKIPVTRILGTLFRFDIAVLLFLIMRLILGRGDTGMSLKTILLSFTSWSSIGNSNWYIFAILVCYLLTFISFEIFRDKCKYLPSAALLTLLVIAYIIVFHIYKLAPGRFYNTIFCYVLGVFLSLFKDKFDKLFGENKLLWFAAFAASCVLTVVCWIDHTRFYKYEICMFSFTLAFVLLTMRISFNNKILRWFGEHLFSVYILQRIPMIVFDKLGLSEYNIYIYFVVCFALTAAMAYLFDKCVNPLWALITKTKPKKLN